MIVKKLTTSSLPGRQATENHTKNAGAAMVLYFTGNGNSRYLARRIAEGLEMPLYDLNAVSYTHLDVYKRQE